MRIINGFLLVFVSIPAIAANVENSQCVVAVHSHIDGGATHRIIRGTGTVIDNCNDQQLVLTCCHLFDEPFEVITCKLPKGLETQATLIDFDESYDLAAVAIPHVGVEPINGSSVDVPIDSKVTASGLASDKFRAISGTVTQYTVAKRFGSRITCALMAGNERGARQGDSGGPVVQDGEIVGVITGSLGNDTYFTYGGPLRKFIQKVRARRSPPTTKLPRFMGHAGDIERK